MFFADVAPRIQRCPAIGAFGKMKAAGIGAGHNLEYAPFPISRVVFLGVRS